MVWTEFAAQIPSKQKTAQTRAVLKYIFLNKLVFSTSRHKTKVEIQDETEDN